MAETKIELRKKKSKVKKTAQDFPVVVIGASAGGFNAIVDLLNNFPIESAAAVFIVLHLSELSNSSFLVQHLQKHTELKCRLPANKEEIKSGTLYFALPGMHLMIVENQIIY